jgi:hypothetical protein
LEELKASKHIEEKEDVDFDKEHGGELVKQSTDRINLSPHRLHPEREVILEVNEP